MSCYTHLFFAIVATAGALSIGFYDLQKKYGCQYAVSNKVCKCLGGRCRRKNKLDIICFLMRFLLSRSSLQADEYEEAGTVAAAALIWIYYCKMVIREIHLFKVK